MAVDPWAGHIRAVLYGIQFERDPLDGIDRILEQVVRDASDAMKSSERMSADGGLSKA